MKEITEAIDAWTAGEFNHTMKLWGYCELMTRKDQVLPVTIPDRNQVAIDDRYEIVTWIRREGNLSLGNEIEGNDWSFGLQQAPVQTQNLRIILAHKISIGEDFITDFLKAFPRRFDVDGYSIVSVNKPSISVDTDHEAVYKDELGETVYERHRFTWNVYALTVPIEYIPCEITSP